MPSWQVLCGVSAELHCPRLLQVGYGQAHVGPGAPRPAHPWWALKLPAETAVQVSGAPLTMDEDGSVSE